MFTKHFCISILTLPPQKTVFDILWPLAKIKYLSNTYFKFDFVKRTGWNRRTGWNFFSKSINVQTRIRPCRGEFFLKINKRACTSIRYTRVGESNPQYDDRLFIVHENFKLRIPAEHVVYTNCCFCFVLTFRTILVHNMFCRCCELLKKIYLYSNQFHVGQNQRPLIKVSITHNHFCANFSLSEGYS